MQQPWKDITLSDLPLREDLKLRHAYGAPQLDVPVCLNVNENPYPPSPALVARIATAVADAARGEPLSRPRLCRAAHASGGVSDARHRRGGRRIERLGGQRLE